MATADMTGLAMDTYAHLMAGGKEGPVVVRGIAPTAFYTLSRPLVGTPVS